MSQNQHQTGRQAIVIATDYKHILTVKRVSLEPIRPKVPGFVT